MLNFERKFLYMLDLKIPSFNYKIKKEKNYIFIYDEIRRKYVKLTPEEWVRQHFIHYLINYFQYPKTLISIERGLQYNRMDKRFDIMVYNRDGHPFMIVECKAPTVKINQKTFEQASCYNSEIKANYLVVTNGRDHFCCRIDHESKKFCFMDDLPEFEK